MKGQNQAYQKFANISLVLRTLWLEKGATRVQIAKKLGLDKSTVIHIITRLMEQGIVVPLSKAESSPQGGRKATQLAIQENACCVLGIEIQPLTYKCVILNLGGDILFKRSGRCKTGASFEEKFLAIVNEIERDMRGFSIPIIGISAGVPGWINIRSEKIIYSFLHGLNEYDFYGKIASRFSIPVLIENDANCCAWGELVSFKERQLSDFVYLLCQFHEKEYQEIARCETSLGMGIVVNGKVYYGSNYSAGEFKSVTWDPDNKWEQVGGFEQSELAEIKENRDVLAKFIKEVFKNFSFLVSTLNPSHIFIGGDLKPHKKLVKQVIDTELNNRYIGQKENGCSVAASTLDEYDVAFGSASMFLQQLFAVPELTGEKPAVNLNWDTILKLLEAKKNGGFSEKQNLLALKD